MVSVPTKKTKNNLNLEPMVTHQIVPSNKISAKTIFYSNDFVQIGTSAIYSSCPIAKVPPYRENSLKMMFFDKNGFSAWVN